ncbi:hypothetical protein GCM10023194_66910 [Planotetraspora phitsanulokensis]|uniref:DUF2637 domain-containing protein n=1 Tax=Planotetraspora phitsanulokensis TaxID=575192 RepID=A0A8J3U9W6_9ACTN|nr:DUF2637 domain-containing protein [Planotetraspora phitsanulokensis]GII39747.1 hypothetical protein Pph01_47500 [Planotetraspora phitsanulokensis]
MDANPPGAAGTTSRPSTSTSAGIPLVLRRLVIGLAGLIVAVLAGAACALSFDDLRALAVIGKAEPRLAYLYPTAFDALLVLSLVSVPLLRGGRFLVRAQAALVLLALFAAAASATVTTATDVTFDQGKAAIVVALLPWALLAVGLWMLLLLLKHARASRTALDGLVEESDIVPFAEERGSRDRGESEEPTAPYSVVPAVATSPEQAPPLPVAPHPYSAGVVDDTHAGSDSAQEPEALPVVPPTAAPETPEVTEPSSPPEPVRPPSPRRNRPNRPITWGDFVRPSTGDVLVHPRLPQPGAPVAEELPAPTSPVTEESTPEPAAPAFGEGTREASSPVTWEAATLQNAPVADPPHEDPAPVAPAESPHEDPVPVTPADLSEADVAEVEAAEVDTQPLRLLEDDPDPAHKAELADPEESSAARRQPYGAEAGGGENTVPLAPPSGRMRSTPLPPDEESD